jgi:hypothetical protein
MIDDGYYLMIDCIYDMILVVYLSMTDDGDTIYAWLVIIYIFDIYGLYGYIFHISLISYYIYSSYSYTIYSYLLL